MEGISQEAISLAGHLKLGHLICFWDNNSISIDGATSLAVSDNEVDALPRLRLAYAGDRRPRHRRDPRRHQRPPASVTDKPTMIACKTIIGFGFPTKAGTQKAHSDAPGEEEIAGARENPRLGFAPVRDPRGPADANGARSAPRAARPAWPGPTASRRRRTGCAQDFERRTRGELPADWKKAIAAARAEFIESGKDMATRQASGARAQPSRSPRSPNCWEARPT